MTYPNPCLYQIEKDLTRTFPNIKDPQQMNQLVVPLRNVLSAYVQRCPTIGYCQGWNQIAARLLLAMESQEEAFWTLVQIAEVFLPCDQYPNLLGITLDMRVFEVIMREKMPKLYAHL